MSLSAPGLKSSRTKNATPRKELKILLHHWQRLMTIFLCPIILQISKDIRLAMHTAQGSNATCSKTNKWRKDFLECIILRKNLNSSANGDNNLIPPLQIAHFNCHICRMQNNFFCIVMLWPIFNKRKVYIITFGGSEHWKPFRYFGT